MKGRVTLTGWLSTAQMLKVFGKDRIVVLLSRWNEPLPYVPVESQLVGRPVLAMSVGGVQETCKIGFFL